MKKQYIKPGTLWADYALDYGICEVGANTSVTVDDENGVAVKRENPWDEDNTGSSRGSLWEEKW